MLKLWHLPCQSISYFCNKEQYLPGVQQAKAFYTCSSSQQKSEITSSILLTTVYLHTAERSRNPAMRLWSLIFQTQQPRDTTKGQAAKGVLQKNPENQESFSNWLDCLQGNRNALPPQAREWFPTLYLCYDQQHWSVKFSARRVISGHLISL